MKDMSQFLKQRTSENLPILKSVPFVLEKSSSQNHLIRGDRLLAVKKKAIFFLVDQRSSLLVKKENGSLALTF